MPTHYFKTLLIGTAFLTATTACSAFQTQESTDPNAPVETKKPNNDYKPAFPGQTRAPGVKTKTPISATVIASGLKMPWGLRCLPDGRFLITGKGGIMQIYKTDGKLDKDITGLPAVVLAGQGGLLDVNIDPDFKTNRMVYWDYAEAAEGGTWLAVAKGKLSADETKMEDVTVIYRASPVYKGSLQFGSRILFDKQNNLFISTGERGANDIRIKAQDLTATIGKVIHITKDGKPVPNGPFAGKADAKPEIFAYGLRNPEGMTWNPLTGELWEAEFGPQGGDEINIIRSGQNYGWPLVTYGIEYSGAKVGEGIQQQEGVAQPVYYWNPSISPAGITFYTGDMIPEWKNNLFVGGLSGSHIARLIIKDNKVVGEERLLKDKNERWRALITGKDGALYGVTDNGNLYRIAKQ